jgi:hypothetical protein
MATVTDKRKVLSVEGNAKVIRHIGNGGMEGGGIWSRKFYGPKIWKNGTKIISAYEQNGSRIK